MSGKNELLDSEMGNICSILSARQIAQFILWIQDNPATMQVTSPSFLLPVPFFQSHYIQRHLTTLPNNPNNPNLDVGGTVAASGSSTAHLNPPPPQHTHTCMSIYLFISSLWPV